MVVFSKFARIQGALKFDFEKELTEVNKVHESCKKEIVYYLSFSISAMTLFFFFGDERDCNRCLPLNLPFYFVIPSLVVVAALRRDAEWCLILYGGGFRLFSAF